MILQKVNIMIGILQNSALPHLFKIRTKMSTNQSMIKISESMTTLLEMKVKVHAPKSVNISIINTNIVNILNLKYIMKMKINQVIILNHLTKMIKVKVKALVIIVIIKRVNIVIMLEKINLALVNVLLILRPLHHVLIVHYLILHLHSILHRVQDHHHLLHLVYPFHPLFAHLPGLLKKAILEAQKILHHLKGQKSQKLKIMVYFLKMFLFLNQKEVN